MLLISAGNQIAGGATVNNSYSVANEDIACSAMGEIAHPDNIKNTYGWYLAQKMGLSHKCLSINNCDNAQLYNKVKDFVTNSLPELRSNYTVLVVGWMPDQHKQYSSKTEQLCKDHGVQYYAFDMTLDFVAQCKKNNQLTKQNYPNGAAHNSWATHLFNKITEQEQNPV